LGHLPEEYSGLNRDVLDLGVGVELRPGLQVHLRILGMGVVDRNDNSGKREQQRSGQNESGEPHSVPLMKI